MKNVAATEFIKNIGTYMDAAHREPLAVTRHGRQWLVMLSPDEFERLKQAAEAAAEIPAIRQVMPPSHDPNHAMKTALSIINTSTRTRITAKELHALIRKPKPAFKAQARLLIEEVPEQILAGLVKARAATWPALYELARWADVVDHEKTTFLRDMAGIGLEHPAAPSHPHSR
ncbi:type II toxin-antitoxin system Phd/YefM family antitoxin [Ferrovibrio sp.]|uniref:type II toxin-antitoxin system Phd/YefM family antitoxin n=1 Tax=Ferrovibrio sp. TaxID=1917215 RepID=UPI003D12968B